MRLRDRDDCTWPWPNLADHHAINACPAASGRTRPFSAAWIVSAEWRVRYKIVHYDGTTLIAFSKKEG
jgi:hypothetical protein